MDDDGRTVAVLNDRVLTVAATGSTNADLLAAAAAGAPDGSWLRAERQTAGRGRAGRIWAEADGNLYASTIIRLNAGDPPAPTLALVAAVALAEAIALFLPPGVGPVRIKWPNDLMLDGAKLSGILLERQGDAVVAGFGVNLGAAPAGIGQGATSLTAHGIRVSPDAFVEVLADCADRWIGRWRNEGFGCVRTAWLRAAHPVGTAIAVRAGTDKRREGLFDGLDSDGGLILRLADGSRHVMHAGDIFLL